MIRANEVSAIILAGGEGRRMENQDKGWITFKGKPLIQHAIEHVRPQVQQIFISANRNLERYQRLGFPVIADETPFLGPLAGISACLRQIPTEYALVVPVDVPSLPMDLTEQLILGLPASLVLCHDKDRLQPLCGLYKKTLWQSMSHFLDSGERKLMLWCQQQSPAIITLKQEVALDNINTPTDLSKLET